MMSETELATIEAKHATGWNECSGRERDKMVAALIAEVKRLRGAAVAAPAPVSPRAPAQDDEPAARRSHAR